MAGASLVLSLFECVNKKADNMASEDSQYNTLVLLFIIFYSFISGFRFFLSPWDLKSCAFELMCFYFWQHQMFSGRKKDIHIKKPLLPLLNCPQILALRWSFLCFCLRRSILLPCPLSPLSSEESVEKRPGCLTCSAKSIDISVPLAFKGYWHGNIFS